MMDGLKTGENEKSEGLLDRAAFFIDMIRFWADNEE